MAERVRTPLIAKGDPPRDGGAKANKPNSSLADICHSKSHQGELEGQKSHMGKVQLLTGSLWKGWEPLDLGNAGWKWTGCCANIGLKSVHGDTAPSAFLAAAPTHPGILQQGRVWLSRLLFPFPGLSPALLASALGSESIFLKSQNGLGWKEP